MSSEKQNKEYWGFYIAPRITNNDAFRQFRREKIKKETGIRGLFNINQHRFANALFFLEQASPDGTTQYYVYDPFQYTKKSLEQLQKVDEKDVPKIAGLTKGKFLPFYSLERQVKPEELANKYGCPDNYASSINKGKGYGWMIGGGIGIVLGMVLFVFLYFHMSVPILSLMMDNTSPLIGWLGMMLLAVLELSVTLFSSRFIFGSLGAVVGSGISAFYHWSNKNFLQSKLKNSEEDVALKTSKLPDQASAAKQSPPSAPILSQNADASNNNKDDDQLTTKAFLKAFRLA